MEANLNQCSLVTFLRMRIDIRNKSSRIRLWVFGLEKRVDNSHFLDFDGRSVFRRRGYPMDISFRSNFGARVECLGANFSDTTLGVSGIRGSLNWEVGVE